MPAPERTAFRLPRTAYLVVVFLTIGVAPFALGAGVTPSGHSGGAELTPAVLLFLIPIAAAVFIARTVTVVDAGGITVRAVLGNRRLPWSDLRGVSVQGSAVYAVLDDGMVRLPFVQVRTLAQLSAASGGHLPELRPPAPKQPPGVRRRR